MAAAGACLLAIGAAPLLRAASGMTTALNMRACTSWCGRCRRMDARGGQLERIRDSMMTSMRHSAALGDGTDEAAGTTRFPSRAAKRSQL